MFLRQMIRKKDGKEHRYFSVVENKRVAGGRVVQRHVLYLGEINDTQELAWRKSIEVFDEGVARPRRLTLSQMRLCRPRKWGAVLAGSDAVAGAASRSVLGKTIAGEPQGYAVGSSAICAGGVQAVGPRQRMAVAP